ncbi:LuxR C-terminal-related transcriptional regulator [Halorussus halophilus]|uniref:LuxR C-terminal-related transcriptional regulator n=1 Tax=Halorussus halophilus TaxID=2650975 RepID=UPI00130152EC|nr:helix-turn-helix transcriptional regulator [Halorussus halophilus]
MTGQLLATGSPVPTHVVAESSDQHDIDQSELADALATIYEDLLDGGDAILQHYAAENPDRPPVVTEQGLTEVIYVDSAQWDQMAKRLEFSEELREAAMTAHAEYAREVDENGDSERESDESDSLHALVMPSRTVAELVRAGLSDRQATVQTLRMAGHTQEQIGDELGMQVGTVKSHCGRIDQKVRNAERLLELVE